MAREHLPVTQRLADRHGLPLGYLAPHEFQGLEHGTPQNTEGRHRDALQSAVPQVLKCVEIVPRAF